MKSNHLSITFAMFLRSLNNTQYRDMITEQLQDNSILPIQSIDIFMQILSMGL